MAGNPIVVNIKTTGQPGSLIGHVVDAGGNSIANAKITIVDVTGKVVASRTLTAQGNFVEKVGPGTYTITVTAPGYAAATSAVNVAAGQLENVTVTLQRP